MKDKSKHNHHHSRFNSNGASPHYVSRLDEIEVLRPKSTYFHGSTGCTVAPEVVSLNFLQYHSKHK
jgi:hypothetical protein